MASKFLTPLADKIAARVKDNRDTVGWQEALWDELIYADNGELDTKQVDILFDMVVTRWNRVIAVATPVTGLEVNARLIAAAPDMLAALQKIIDMNVQYAIDRYGSASEAETMGCVQVARAAIAKATA